VTSPGRGTYVAEPNVEFMREARLREVEESLANAVDAARAAGIGRKELSEMIDLAWEDR